MSQNLIVEIRINPACSKRRTATSILDGAGADDTVRRHLGRTDEAVRSVLSTD